MAELLHAYAEITKAERNDEGDLVVTGRATSPDLDLDRQICDPEWLAKAMPEWYSTGANVREMHTSIAAGRGDALVQNGDGWDLRSIVVDPVSARKVEKGVLRGYSIGIRNPLVVEDKSARGGRIAGGQIVEISLVDRPANPTCQLVMTKSLKPGPQTAQVVDAERRLVKVEELHDHTGEPLAALTKALETFDLVAVQKGNSKGQIKDARRAIALLAGVVQAEAVCLAEGSPTAGCDIDTLMGAIHAIEYFLQREKEPAMAHVELSADADIEKAAAPDAAAPPAAPVADVTKAKKKPSPDDDTESTDDDDTEDAAEKAATPETPDLTELVKAAVAQAVAPLEAQLAKALAAPQAGGPVLTRTQQDTNKAAVREGLLTKAAEYDATATQLSGDPNAQRAYRAEAKKLRDQAASTS